MSIRSMLVAAAFASTSPETVHADDLRPMSAISLDLGEVSGLAPGQSLAFSTPRQEGAFEPSRNGDSVLVRKVKSVSN
jgi:hypothetical protein